MKCMFCGAIYTSERSMTWHLHRAHRERMLLARSRDRDERWQRSTCCQSCIREYHSEFALMTHTYAWHGGNWAEVDVPPVLTIVEEPG